MKGHRLKAEKVIEELDDLDELKKRSERTKLKDKMVKTTSSSRLAPQIELTYTFLKLPLVPGSKESKEMLQVLDDLGNSEIFETDLIRNFLEFKWKKVQPLAYIMMFIYIGYLVCIAITESWISVLTWLIYFVLIEVWQIHTAGTDDDDKWEKFEQWARSPWNWLDIFKMIFMILVLVFSSLEECEILRT
jgi:hypothetical protein